MFWVFLVSVNALHVKAYGELGMPLSLVHIPVLLDQLKSEYWLSSLKVATIIVFIIVGILVNVGVNQDHHYIGVSNWKIDGAPFVGGFGGFARVFVTASFACEILELSVNSCLILELDGGTESLAIAAGETKNPTRNIPQVVKLVFWRCVQIFFSRVALLINRP